MWYNFVVFINSLNPDKLESIVIIATYYIEQFCVFLPMTAEMQDFILNRTVLHSTAEIQDFTAANFENKLEK